MAAGTYTWQITDSNGSTVADSIMEMSGNGTLTVYTTDLEGTFMLKAVSTENSQWFGEKTITLAKAPSEVTNIEINGSGKLTIPDNGSTSSAYTATVYDQFNEPMADETVNWMITDVKSRPVSTMSVDNNGLLTVSNTAVPGLYIVKASTSTSPGTFVTMLLDLAKAEPVPPAGTVYSRHVQLLETAAVDKAALNLAYAQVQADSKGVKTVKVTIDAVDGVDNYMLLLPVEALTGGTGNKKLEIICPTGTVTLSDNMFKHIKDLNNASQVGIYIGKPDMTRFNKNTVNKLGNSPAMEIKVVCKGEEIRWGNNNVPVKITLDYTPTAEELNNPNRITLWYVNGRGELDSVKNGVYDPAAGKVTYFLSDF
jgi:hypothetical protein